MAGFCDAKGPHYDDAFLTVNKQPDVGADAPAMVVNALPDQQLVIVLKGTRVISLMTNYVGNRDRRTASRRSRSRSPTILDGGHDPIAGCVASPSS